jgi:tRNA pseudouridine55 synthase
VKRALSELNGIVPVDKPEGPSSSQVVGRVKRALGAKKAGHLGTLDPFASGLLLVGIGEGTKIAQFFLEAHKRYSGVIELGLETDTQDRTGRPVRRQEVPRWGEAELERLRASFTGTIRQTPPMFSALKRGGVRLYRLARRGESVPREPREVQIERLRLWKISEREIGFELTCSKGTYIRTLAADLGAALGCGGHLKSLRRLACGRIALEQAVPLEEIESGKSFRIVSLNEALGYLKPVAIDRRRLVQLKMGQQGVLATLEPPAQGESVIRLVDHAGELHALAHWIGAERQGQWRLLRVFSDA